MSHSTDVPLTLYTRVEIEKPLRTPNQNYYVSKPHNPHMPRVGNSHRGRFPSYYVENEHYNNGESSHRMESKIAQNPKPEVVKTEKVDHSANKLGTTNNMLSFFQAVMIIVLLMRLGRNTSERLRKKHEARKKLLKFLDNENKKIRIDDKLMAEKCKKLEEKIKKEEEKMELKWKEIRAKLKLKMKTKPSKNHFPGIGPFYDKDKRRLDRRMNAVDIKYEKYKLKKKKRWCAMKAAYHKKLRKLQRKQENRKQRKCKRMFVFERDWNFGPSSIKKYINQREDDYKNDDRYYRKLKVDQKAADKAKEEAEKKAKEEAEKKAQEEAEKKAKEEAEKKAQEEAEKKAKEEAEKKAKEKMMQEEFDAEYEYYVDDDYDGYGDHVVYYFINSDDDY
ncbi:hypothetical protein AK88_03548 [Plasmodium fragile]|uniref:Uncharacterized protein n=1 Tax=Plasmodium fragile TaxID=5857 RepID=A0A0D9QIH9_PLAFR|nr:uncharacterized protein AK88_03548 [Plasmodium fragile]KJP86839.1 hypothetical protein AK88_03548 [Plasmodium fragile]